MYFSQMSQDNLELKLIAFYKKCHYYNWIVVMEEAPKREGSDLKQLQKEVKQQNTTDRICIWGIERFFDPKSCYKFFCKNFGEHAEVTHVLKQKNRPFFMIKFSTPINVEDFNNRFAKNKRNKAKAPQQNMDYHENEFITVEECTRHAEKKEVKATEQEIEKIRNTKIQDIVEPLHALPYEEQVQWKKNDLNRVIENYNRQFFKDNEVRKLISENRQMKQLKLDEFIECQVKRQGYRSKSQFTIGYNFNNEIVIGFNKGSYQNQTITIQSPRNVKIISKNTKLIVALMEHFIKTNFTELPPYNRIKQAGFWRYLIVRESERLKQSMVMVVAKADGIQPELLKQVKDSLVEYMKRSIIGLVGLCFLDYRGQADSVPTEKPELLYGTPYYQQRIFDHTFQVSPTAFLQINIEMCEILYTHIIQAVKDCDIVLDLGCGIGTIGISIQKKLPNLKVIGIEICAEAVEDAKKNSQTYEVHLGRAEDHIKAICDQYRGNRIVAILDPPRAGFNKEVILALRRCRGLDNIIYVACNAGAVQDNLLQLTLPVTDKRRAPEFIVKEMKGFDLFPLTHHYEALYILERTQ